MREGVTMGDKHEPQISANAKLREERNSARRQVDTLIAENLELKAAVSALRDQLRVQYEQAEGERRAYHHMLYVLTDGRSGK
jgi:hypothetical protein